MLFTEQLRYVLVVSVSHWEALAISVILFVSAGVLGGMALVLLIPTMVLAIECFSALLSASKLSSYPLPKRPRIDILVPAHNEEIGIIATLNALLSQLVDGDRLIVVADNCDDETAALAQTAGAIVIERNDLKRHGKGYALDCGLKFIALHPPEIVIVIDADCIVQEGAIEQIACQSLTTDRPVQALYLLDRSTHPSLKTRVSEFAFLVKNLVRPRGLDNLGFPCMLTGSGMAFPWAVINQMTLGSSNIVEDMQLALDLSIAGYPTQFCFAGQVTGQLPQQQQAIKTQRTRWEHGHLQTLLTQVPRLCKSAIAQKRFDLWVLALDLSVPPLSLLVLLWIGITALTIPISEAGIFWPLGLMLVEGGLLLGGIFAAWMRFGRDLLPLHTLLSVPLYVLWKIPIYLAFMIRPQTNWIRTARDPLDRTD